MVLFKNSTDVELSVITIPLTTSKADAHVYYTFNGFLSMQDSAKPCSGHLENVKLLNYTDLPKLYTRFLKSHLNWTSTIRRVF